MKIRLGTEFKKYLEDNFITVKTLADELGISHQGLHKIVSGKTKRPYNSTLKKIASRLSLQLGSDDHGIFFTPDEEDSFDSSPVDRSTEILSTKLASLITDRGLTAKKVADEIGKSEKLVREYMHSSNPKIPDIPTLKKLATLFNVSVDFLVTDEQAQLKEKILANLKTILDEGKTQHIIDLKERLPHHPEERNRRFRKLLDILETVSPETLELLNYLTSMEGLLFRDKWLMPHIQQIVESYLGVKDLWFELFWDKAQDTITDCRNTLHQLAEKSMLAYPEDKHRLGSSAVRNYVQKSLKGIFASDINYWRKPYSERYWTVNEEAIKRGVNITRIFVYSPEALKDSLDVLKRQQKIGVDVYVAFTSDVPSYLIKHLLIIDERIFSTAELTNDGRIISETTCIDEILVDQMLKHFDQLLRYSKTLDKFLEFDVSSG